MPEVVPRLLIVKGTPVVVVPMPTLPEELTTKEEAPAVFTWNLAIGLIVVPIPRFPLLVKRKLKVLLVPIPTLPFKPESNRILPELYVLKVRSDELNTSPATRYKGAALFIYEAVGLVKFIS